MANIALLRLLERPIITEKAAQLMAFNQYVFQVNRHANKVELTKAFELAFPGRKVTAVRKIHIPPGQRRVGRKVGQAGEQYKAIFTITGEPLEFLSGDFGSPAV